MKKDVRPKRLGREMLSRLLEVEECDDPAELDRARDLACWDCGCKVGAV